jgi:hypothetical protein
VNPLQTQLFQPSRNLSDVPLEQRLAAVERLLKDDPGMATEDRWMLFGLVVNPSLFGSMVES